MNYSKIIFASAFLAFALSLGASSLRAQEEPAQQQPPPDAPPKPAAKTFPVPVILYGDQEDDSNRNGLRGDYTPLTGIQNATLGIPDFEHSYWVPGIQYGATVISPPSNQPGSSWYINNYVVGNLSVLDTWSRAQFAFNYSGGGYFSSDSSQGNGQYQTVGLSETFHSDRWLFQVLDQFSYLPQSSFGFGGGTNLGVPGVGGSLGSSGPGLGNNFVPNQSIAGFGPRYSNAAGLQFTYALSKRSSFTAYGTYGLLTFINPGNFDSTTLSAGFGYNYAITRKDTIGVVYRFTNNQYPGNPQAYADQTASFAYGRKITGRIGLQLLAGPEYTRFRIPIGTTSSQLGASVSAYLTYGFEKGSITGGYNHGLSGGSGVLIGSISDQVNLGVSRKLTRPWTGFLSVGYAHNRPVVSSATAGASYNSTYVGGGVGRPFGRNLNFSVAYTASINNTGSGGCTGQGCGTNYNYQSVTINVQWHTRPFLIPSF
jgi:hypothetical protein